MSVYLRKNIVLTTLFILCPKATRINSYVNLFFPFPKYMKYPVRGHFDNYCTLPDCVWSLWPIKFWQLCLVQLLASHPLWNCYVVFVPVFPGSAAAHNILRTKSLVLVGKCSQHVLRHSFVYVCTGSAFLAFLRLVSRASGLSIGCTAFVSSWASLVSEAWPYSLLVLLTSYSCRLIDLCAPCIPNRPLPIHQSLLLPVSTLQFVYHKMIKSSFKTFCL